MFASKKATTTLEADRGENFLPKAACFIRFRPSLPLLRKDHATHPKPQMLKLQAVKSWSACDRWQKKETVCLFSQFCKKRKADRGSDEISSVIYRRAKIAGVIQLKRFEKKRPLPMPTRSQQERPNATARSNRRGKSSRRWRSVNWA